MALSFNYYALKVQRLEKICKVTQNSHFLKKYKGGTKGNFSKIAKQVALAWNAQKHSGANGILI